MRKFKEVYPGEGIRALSWKEPFASLMLHGKVETRTWDTKYRGWVLICASKCSYNYGQTIAITGQSQFDRVRAVLNKPLKDIRYKDFEETNAKAIAVGMLTGSALMDRIVCPPGETTPHNFLTLAVEDSTFVQYRQDSGLWMHYYMNVQPIVPFDWKGTQGWKTLDQETIDKIVLI